MLRVRFHGRGGQGMKTASRILGSALFRAGFEVQDAPRYGAERRGAPIFAYVRADHRRIDERGPIPLPDLVVVADDTLVAIPAAGVLTGLDAHAVLLIDSAESVETWRSRLNLAGPVLVLPRPAQLGSSELRYIGAACAGAAARLLGVVSEAELCEALKDEFDATGEEVVTRNREIALRAWRAMAEAEACVSERGASTQQRPQWIDLALDPVLRAAPDIHAELTSVAVKTGLWRTMRPVIDESRCKRCWWVCSTFCPDHAIEVTEDGRPRIDYEHCKGCMVCVAQCPPHAIETLPEAAARAVEGAS